MTCSSTLISNLSGWVCTEPTTDKSVDDNANQTSKTEASSYFDIRGIVAESSENNTTAVKTYHYVRNAFQCSGKDLLQCAPPVSGRGGVDDAATMSDSYNDDDESDDDEYQQMRRLASWGTFGTIGTTDSLDINHRNMEHTNVNGSSIVHMIDDDGHPIDPQIAEKSIQRNRAKLQQQQQVGDHTNKYSSSAKPKRRSVKFAYPPITSLKQCPRIDPEELDDLFFSDQELATYEHDRRSTGAVDDVEIVAISTSTSDDDKATKKAPKTSAAVISPEKDVTSTVPEQSTDFSSTKNHVMTPKTTFRFKSLMLSSPRSLLRNSTTTSLIAPKLKGKNSFGSSMSSSLGKGSSKSSATDENSSALPETSPTTDDPMINANEKKEASATAPEPPKRLLKSVQIFLRERSTA